MSDRKVGHWVFSETLEEAQEAMRKLCQEAARRTKELRQEAARRRKKLKELREKK